MASTVRAYASTGATESGARASIDTVGGTPFRFNRADSLTDTTPIPVPQDADTTAYSWIKNTYLYVTTADGTSLSNRRVHAASTPTTGLYLYFKGDAAYAQAASGNMPADGGSNGAVPSGYTAMTTSPQSYSAGGSAAANTSRNGDLCVLLLGVGNNYAGGGGSAALPNVVYTYDES